jgi:hypothetical protein
VQFGVIGAVDEYVVPAGYLIEFVERAFAVVADVFPPRHVTIRSYSQRTRRLSGFVGV